MRKITAFILSGILVLGGLSWLAGPTSAYAAPIPSQGQTQQVEPELPLSIVTIAPRIVRLLAAYIAYKAAQAILNGQGPGDDLTTVPEGVF
jgi:hypothetical protein